MFLIRLFTTMLFSLKNNYKDNYDFQRFGVPLYKTPIKKIKNILGSRYYNNLRTMLPYYQNLNKIYYLLSDLNSRELYTKVLAYRILGYKKVKLPLNNKEREKKVEYYKKYADYNDFIDVDFIFDRKLRLFKFDLTDIMKEPFSIFATERIINNNIYDKQYKYSNATASVKPDFGDVVFDCGACYGDTTLFFAHEVGEDGMVYSFEFNKNNLNVMNKNVQLNSILKKRIKIVPKPLSRVPNEEFCFYENGPGSNIKSKQFGAPKLYVYSESIDNFVDKEKIKVDFIKMDIEGSELDALKGGEITIRKFKPKLAISIYHSMDDFANIPLWIYNLNLGYKFYIGHYSIHSEETILYARA